MIPESSDISTAVQIGEGVREEEYDPSTDDSAGEGGRWEPRSTEEGATGGGGGGTMRLSLSSRRLEDKLFLIDVKPLLAAAVVPGEVSMAEEGIFNGRMLKSFQAK